MSGRSAKRSRTRISVRSTTKRSLAGSSAHSERLFKSSISNLILPVPRIKAILKVNNYATRVSDTAAVYLTAVLEYITTEILELSLNAALSSGNRRIHAKHINKALKTDPELLKNFRNTIVPQGGIIPFQNEKFMRLTENVPLHVEMEEHAQRASRRKSGNSATSKNSSKASRRRG